MCSYLNKSAFFQRGISNSLYRALFLEIMMELNVFWLKRFVWLCSGPVRAALTWARENCAGLWYSHTEANSVIECCVFSFPVAYLWQAILLTTVNWKKPRQTCLFDSKCMFFQILSPSLGWGSFYPSNLEHCGAFSPFTPLKKYTQRTRAVNTSQQKTMLIFISSLFLCTADICIVNIPLLHIIKHK